MTGVDRAGPLAHPMDNRFKTLSLSWLRENDPHVLVVGLNRPRKRNAINAKMWREIGEAFRLIGSTGDGCRCVLVVGHGKGFCAGIDVSDPSFGLMSSTEEEEEEVDVARKYLKFRPQILEMQSCLTAVEQCSVPVVAAIHGSCIGAGVDLTCCADIRVCAPSTCFAVREVKLGLAADVGTLQRLPKIIGHGSRVRELCLTGQDFDAAEALRIGFVSRLSNTDADLFATATTICQKIANNSPVAVAGTKLSLNYSRDHTVQDGLDHIATYNAAALMTDDLIKAFQNAASSQKQDHDAVIFDNLQRHSRL
mmetsp:Transcript_9058/g.16487  ORF Transcript_9058/g.16487 Transcript_9058/m.16487 type:complete len:309 (-) Transcript_9058:1527-2453(-)